MRCTTGKASPLPVPKMHIPSGEQRCQAHNLFCGRPDCGGGLGGPTGACGVPGAAERDAGEDGAEPSLRGTRTTAPREHGREPGCSRGTSDSLPLRCVLCALVMPWKPILSLPSHSPSHSLLSSGHVCQSLCLPFLDLVLNLCCLVKDQQ